MGPEMADADVKIPIIRNEISTYKIMIFIINSWDTPEWALAKAGAFKSMDFKAIDSVNADNTI